MFLDYIEIGTSDFDTEIQKANNKIGISIEPIKYYIDRLPTKPGCYKMNVAISNTNGTVKVYYLSEECMKKYYLPEWIRGCNSINAYHPSAKKLLEDRGIDIANVVTSYDVEVKTLMNVFIEKNIEGVHYLKIDTEGHDTIILEKFYNDITNNKQLPHKILFESNILSNNDNIHNIINLYNQLGYDLMYKGENDTLLQLNLKNIKNKTSFTGEIKNYYIEDYPINYDVTNLPHTNTLEDAQKYCREHNYSGVTYQNGKYEVRDGKYIKYDNTVKSWVYL